MERVALDLVGPLPETDGGNKWVLVIADYFTKWMEACPLPDSTAETVAKAFVENFVCRYGVPKELHSDQGRNFEADIFAEMCKILGIRKTRTVAYNPKSDGLVEGYNKTLINTVSMMLDPNRNQRDWDQQLPFATFAYRSVPQESTGETPNMLMLGREVMLPVDLTTEEPLPDEAMEPNTDYGEELRRRMQRAHERAREQTRTSTRRQKLSYDRKVEGIGYNVGEFIWLYNPAKKKGVCPKLVSRWEGPHLIIKKLSDVNYRIQSKPRGKMLVVHFDRMKPYQGPHMDAWHTETPTRVTETPIQLDQGQSPEQQNHQRGAEAVIPDIGVEEAFGLN
jgi:hypothetical protein